MQSSQEVQAAKMTILERPLDGRGVKAVGYQLGLYSLEGFYARCCGEKGLEYIGPVLTVLGIRTGPQML